MKFSKLGRYYIAIMVIILLAATNTKANLLHLLTSFFLALLVFSWFLAKRNLAAIQVNIESPPEIFAGTAFSMRYLITNQSGYRKFAISCLDVLMNYQLMVLEIPALSTLELHRHYQRGFLNRGRKQWTQFSLHTAFPFGFFQCAKQIVANHEILVLPRPLPVLNISIPHHWGTFHQGKSVSVPRASSQEFANLREYKPGDSQKNIHWKATAKTNQLIIKEFEEQLPAGVTLIVDTFAPLYAPETKHRYFEKAMTVAASLAWEISKRDNCFMFAYGEHLLEYGHGEEHARCVLRILAAADVERDTTTAMRVQPLNKIRIAGTVIVIALQIDDQIANECQRLLRTNCRLVVVVIDTSKARALNGIKAYTCASIAGQLQLQTL